MPMLKEVEVSFSNTETGCNFWKSHPEDQNVAIHKNSQCCVDVRAIWKECPRVHRFNGVCMEEQREGKTFNKWMLKVKRAFFKDYEQRGGTMALKLWGKTRWNSKFKK